LAGNRIKLTELSAITAATQARKKPTPTRKPQERRKANPTGRHTGPQSRNQKETNPDNPPKYYPIVVNERSGPP